MQRIEIGDAVDAEEDNRFSAASWVQSLLLRESRPTRSFSRITSIL
jgi:hypothetical protein